MSGAHITGAPASVTLPTLHTAHVHQTPTVGRAVHVHNLTTSPGKIHANLGQPFAGTIAYVAEGGRHIAVGGFDASGDHFAAARIPLIQAGDPAPAPGSVYATFPPRV